LQQEFGGAFKLVILDVDDAEEVFTRCRISGYPTIRIYREGRSGRSYGGGLGMRDLRAYLEKNFPR
jgi:thioredoxin-like negative regulator of GroEL